MTSTQRSIVLVIAFCCGGSEVLAQTRRTSRVHGGGEAQRASDRGERHRRFDRTRDPTTRRGRPIRIPLTTPPVAFAPPPPPDPTATRPYDHVLIISLDGLRPDAIARTDAPNLLRMRAQGADATEARTITHSYTLPSHTSMLSGIDTDRHRLLHNEFRPNRGFTQAPTIFYYAHDEALETAMFVSKPKLRHIAVPGTVDVFSRPSHNCETVAARAGEHLRRGTAGITFVHFSEPDDAGHRRGWMTEAYLRNVAHADHCVGMLMESVSARTDVGRVLVLVSADHGGHGRTHGSEREEDMRIPWIAWGSRVTPGAFATPVNTMDTAATALSALRVPLPSGLVGRPVQRVLERETTRRR